MKPGTPASAETLLFARTTRRSMVLDVVRSILAVAGVFVLTRCGAAWMFGDSLPGSSRLGLETLAIVVGAGIALVTLTMLPIRSELLQVRDVLTENEADLRARNQGQRFLRDVRDAFEMAEYEAELFEVMEVALHDAGPGQAEILVADSSNAHVARVAIATGREAPGCGVTTPQSCPAVRQGGTLKFDDPNGLAACPRLRERSYDTGSVATCIPINILGTPSAVLHAVYKPDQSATDPVDLDRGVRALEGVAIRFGGRLGMMRAMSRSQLQADTDPLTGLLNRRAMEDCVREIRSEHRPFALALADLDHFKDLNDTFGHDTGDRALRLFARVAENAVRDGDVVCRYGGEEFVFIFLGADVVSAAPVLHRLRQNLAAATSDAKLPQFTVSAGLVDSTWATDLPKLIRSADRGLMLAKASGRDRIVIDDPAIPSIATEFDDAPMKRPPA